MYCRIRLKGLLHDAERDLLAVAKLLVQYDVIGPLPIRRMACQAVQEGLAWSCSSSFLARVHSVSWQSVLLLPARSLSVNVLTRAENPRDVSPDREKLVTLIGGDCVQQSSEAPAARYRTTTATCRRAMLRDRWRYSYNGILIRTYTYMPYSRVLFRMILSDLEIFNDIARPLCDSWASCFYTPPSFDAPVKEYPSEYCHNVWYRTRT